MSLSGVRIQLVLYSTMRSLDENHNIVQSIVQYNMIHFSRFFMLSQQTQSLSEKSRELDKLRSEWTSHTTTLTNKHTQELTNEKEKALQV